MAIVLAIEPDRRQAAHLTAIVRNQVAVELVIADTTEGALDAIGNRVPDLVLVPALLSPQDDAALAAALRVIAAAAHVRTLTIPVLASTAKRKPVAGMLAKWRKSRAASQEPEGCEPSVFGEQIAAYLQEAAAERAQLEEDALLNAERLEATSSIQLDTALQLDAAASSLRVDERSLYDAPEAPLSADTAFDAPLAAAEPYAVVDSFRDVEPHRVSDAFAAEDVRMPVEPVEPFATEAVAAESIAAEPLADVEPYAAREYFPAVEPEAAVEHAAAVEPVAIDESYAAIEAAPVELTEETWSPVIDPTPMFAGDETVELDADEDPLIDLSEELEGLSVEGAVETFDGEPVGVYTLDAEPEPSVFDVFDAVPGILEPPSITEDIEAALDQIAAAGVQAAPAARKRATKTVHLELVPRPVVTELSESPRSDIAPWVPMFLTPGRIWPVMEGVPAETPTARSEQPDWIELVASLRQDLERRRTDPAAAAEPIAVRPSDGATAKVHRLVKKSRPHVRKAKPVQDEWGFFNPERCGFSTLLAKLEEITEEEVRP